MIDVKKLVYVGPSPEEANTEAGVEYAPAGYLSKPDMVNKDIEDVATRSKIPEKEGNICITILPGEHLGELSFNVQFEGRYGDYDFCLNEHNELLLSVSEWIQELFGELATNFEAVVESRPCPKSAQRVKINLAAQLIEKKITLKQVRRQTQSNPTQEGQNQSRRTHGHEIEASGKS